MQWLAHGGRLVLVIFLLFLNRLNMLQSFYEFNNRLESINTTELFAIASDIYNLVGN